MAANYAGFDFRLDAVPEYTYFMFEVTELQDGTCIQLSDINLLADGNYTPAE